MFTPKLYHNKVCTLQKHTIFFHLKIACLLRLTWTCFLLFLAATKPRRRRKKSKSGESGGAGAKKRKLTEEQVTLLELNFGNEHKLESEKKDRLASELGLDPRQVAVWFQNRRARWKNKKLEEEYSTLKKAHENVVVEKCKLESEVHISILPSLSVWISHLLNVGFTPLTLLGLV